MRHLLLAAEKGDANAQFNLGVLYDNRLDDNNHPTRGNRAEAIKWWQRAALQGLPRAQTRLAEIYAGGPDTPADYVKACAWLLLAAANLSGIHRQRAQSAYEQVSARMTPVQIAKARRLVRAWKPKRQDDLATASATAAS
jgi:TPR repeat protein